MISDVRHRVRLRWRVGLQAGDVSAQRAEIVSRSAGVGGAGRPLARGRRDIVPMEVRDRTSANQHADDRGKDDPYESSMLASLPHFACHPLIMWRSVSTLLIAAMLSASCGGAAPTSRVSRIRQRGFLVCGVFPGIAGFARVDSQGHYTGFDIDICRAVAAAILGSAERIRYQPVASIDRLSALQRYRHRLAPLDLVAAP